MSRRYRLYIAAVGLASLLALSSSHREIERQPVEPREASHAASQQRDRASEPSKSAVPEGQERQDRAPQTEPYRAPCDAPGNNEEAALCAQIAAAEEAKRANEIASASVLTNNVQAVGLVISIFLSGVAALTAVVATRAALRTVHAFEGAEAGALAMQIEGRLERRDGKLIVPLVFQNVGRSTVVVQYFDAWTHEVPRVPYTVPTSLTLRNPEASCAVVPEGKWEVGYITMPDEHNALIGGLIFTDVFGEYHLLEMGMLRESDQLRQSTHFDHSLWLRKVRELKQREATARKRQRQQERALAHRRISQR